MKIWRYVLAESSAAFQLLALKMQKQEMLENNIICRIIHLKVSFTVQRLLP